MYYNFYNYNQMCSGLRYVAQDYNVLIKEHRLIIIKSAMLFSLSIFTFHNNHVSLMGNAKIEDLYKNPQWPV